MLVDFVDRADVRVIERRGGLGFALKPLEGAAVRGQGIRGRNFKATKRPSVVSSAL